MPSGSPFDPFEPEPQSGGFRDGCPPVLPGLGSATGGSGEFFLIFIRDHLVAAFLAWRLEEAGIPHQRVTDPLNEVLRCNHPGRVTVFTDVFTLQRLKGLLLDYPVDIHEKANFVLVTQEGQSDQAEALCGNALEKVMVPSHDQIRGMIPMDFLWDYLKELPGDDRMGTTLSFSEAPNPSQVRPDVQIRPRGRFEPRGAMTEKTQALIAVFDRAIGEAAAAMAVEMGLDYVGVNPEDAMSSMIDLSNLNAPLLWIVTDSFAIIRMASELSPVEGEWVSIWYVSEGDKIDVAKAIREGATGVIPVYTPAGPNRLIPLL